MNKEIEELYKKAFSEALTERIGMILTIETINSILLCADLKVIGYKMHKSNKDQKEYAEACRSQYGI